MKTLIKSNKVSVFNTTQHKSLPKSSNQTQIQKNNIRSKATVIINHHLIHKTTKQSPEKNIIDSHLTTKMRLFSSGIPQYQNSVLRHNKNMINTISAEPHSNAIHVKKANSKPKGIQYNNNHCSINTSTSIHGKIPLKVSKFMTTTVTAKHSRKPSNEKKEAYANNHSKEHHKLIMSQSSSATKIKHILKPKTKDLKMLLTKFSVISQLTSISKEKKNDSFSHNNNNNNNNDNCSNVQYNNSLANSHNNTLITHNNTQGNIDLKTYDKGNMIINTSSNTKNNNKIHQGFDKDNNDERNASNSINSNKHNNNPLGKTHINTNKQQIHHRNMKIQSAFKSLKSINNAFHTNIPIYQKVQISTESCQPSSKISNISINLNQIKKSSEHKTCTESVLQKYTYQSLLYTNSQNNQRHLHINNTSNHSPYKSSSVTAANNILYKNNHPSLQLSNESEANYFKSESMKLSEYIIHSFQTNGGQYPKTNMHFYKIGRAVGHGAFGKVNIGLHILTGRIVAIKSFNKEKSMYYKEVIDNEVKLMKKLRPHKNIVKVFERLDTEKYDCIIMENISGGNLLSLINKRTTLTEETAKFIFKQIIEGLRYIHSQGIVHRDIKPDNILIDLNNTIKLCDFGIAREIKPGQLLNDICGTPAFVAPEILHEDHYDPFPTDIWSSGVVLYSMITGVFPFKGNNEYELNKSILSGKYQDLPKEISSDCKELIQGILEINPDLRMTIEDILNHPWMIQLNHSNIITPFFSNAEKIIYSKLNIDYRTKKKDEVLIELFTYKNIDTSQENENQNIISKSFIVTPYNSNMKKVDYDDNEEVYYQDLFIENDIMKFGPKVNEMNRNYEINNNAEADQGFMIYQHKKRKLKRQLSSVLKSIEGDIAKKQQSSCRRKDPQKRNEGNNCQDTLSTNNTNTLLIEETVVKCIEEFGYKRDYVIRALENNELNHSTATYYLLINNNII